MEPRRDPTLCCGRFTRRTCLFIVLLVLLLLFLLTFLLVLFLRILPRGIEDRYTRGGLDFEALRLTDWTLFPDGTHHASVRVSGIAVHPPSFWGHDAELVGWTFLNARRQPVFNAQPIIEAHADAPVRASGAATPRGRRRRAFTSHMRIQFSNRTARAAKRLNTLLAECFLATFPTPGEHAVKTIRVALRYGLGNAKILQHSVEVPFSTLQRALANTESLPATSQALGAVFQFTKVHMKAVPEGLRLETLYTTQGLPYPFTLPSGTYPVFSSAIPVMMLQVPHGLHVEQTTQNAALDVEFHFARPLSGSGSVIFSSLFQAANTGQLALQVKGPALAPHTDAGAVRDAKWPGLEVPNFQYRIQQMQVGLAQTRVQVRRLVVDGARVSVAVDLVLPRALALPTITTAFGMQCKFTLDAIEMVQVVLTEGAVRPYDAAHHAIHLGLEIVLAQEQPALDALYNLYLSLAGPNEIVKAEVNSFQFFPLTRTHVPCPWCDVLFSEVHFALPLSTQIVKEQLARAIHWIEHAEGWPTRFVRMSQLAVSNKRRPETLSVQAALDMSHVGLDIQVLRLPFTHMTCSFKGTPLAILSLPQGLTCAACTQTLHTLHVDIQLNNDLEAQPLYAALLDHLLRRDLAELVVHVGGVTLGHGPDAVRTLQRFHVPLTLAKLMEWVQKFVRVDLLETRCEYTAALRSMHVAIQDGQHALLATDIDVSHPIPLSLEMDPVAFTVQLFGMHAFSITLPSLVIDRGATHVQLSPIDVQSSFQMPFSPKIISLAASELTSILPTEIVLGSLRLFAQPDEGDVSEACFASLDSFSQFQYRLNLNELQRKMEQRFNVDMVMSAAKAWEVHSVTLQELTFEGTSIRANLEAVYTLDENLSMDVRFISFDIIVNGQKRFQAHIIVDPSRSSIAEKRTLSLQCTLRLYEGEVEEDPECKGQSEQGTTFCLRRVSLGQDASSQEELLPAAILFTDTMLLESMPRLLPYLKRIVFKLGDQVKLDTSTLLTSGALFFFGQPTFQLDALKPLSIAVTTTANTVALDMRVEMPTPLVDIHGFSAEAVLAAGPVPVLRLHANLSNYQASADTCRVQVQAEAWLLELSEGSAQSGDGTDDEQLTQHDRVQAEQGDLPHDVLQKMFASPLRVTLVQVNGAGPFTTAFPHVLHRTFELPMSPNDIQLLLLGGMQRGQDTSELSDALRLLSLHRVDISVQELVLQGATYPSLAADFQCAIPSDAQTRIPVTLHLRSVSVDVFVHDTRVGVFSTQRPFHYDSQRDEGVNATVAYYAEARDEAKAAVSALVHALLKEAPAGSLALKLGNLQLDAEGTHQTTLLSLLSFSMPVQDLKERVKQRALAEATASAQGEMEPNVQDTPIAQEPRPPRGLSTPEVHLHAMSLGVELDSGFDVRLSVHRLRWTSSLTEVEGISVAVNDRNKALAVLPRMHPYFTLFNVRLGSVPALPAQRPGGRGVLIDGFSGLRLDTKDVMQFFPSDRVLAMLEVVKTLALDRIDVHQALAKDVLAQLQTSMRYGQGPKMLLPTFAAEVVVGPDMRAQVESSHATQALHEEMIVTARLMHTREAPDCGDATMDPGTGTDPICIVSADVVDVPADGTHALHVQSKAVVLFIDRDILGNLTHWLCPYAVDMLERSCAHERLANRTEDAHLRPFPSLPEGMNDKALFNVRLVFPHFLNLHVDLQYLRLRVYPSREKQNLFTLDLANVHAAKQREFQLASQLYVQHSLEGPVSHKELRLAAFPEFLQRFQLTIDWGEGTPSYTVDIDNAFDLLNSDSVLAVALLKTTGILFDHVVRYFLGFANSHVGIQNTTARLFGDAPRVEVATQVALTSKDPAIVYADHFLSLEMHNFFVTANVCRIEPRVLRLDKNATVSVLARMDIPKHPKTGALPSDVYAFLPKTLRGNVTNLEDEHEEGEEAEKSDSDEEAEKNGGAEDVAEDDSVEKVQVRWGDEDGDETPPEAAESDRETVEDPEESDESDNEFIAYEENAEENAEAMARLSEANIGPIAAWEEKKEKDTVLAELHSLHFGSGPPTPLGLSVNVPWHHIQEFVNLVNFTTLHWTLHVNFTKEHICIYFGTHLGLDVSFLANDYIFDLSFSFDNELLGHVACKDVQVTKGLMRGSAFVALKPDANYAHLKDLKEDLQRFNVHDLKIFSADPNPKLLRTIFTRKFHLPNDTRDKIKLLLFPILRFHQGNTFSFPHNHTVSIDLPYAQFRVKYMSTLGEGRLEKILIHENKDNFCFETNAESIFVRFSNFLERNSLYLADLHFGASEESAFYLRNLSFNYDLDHQPMFKAWWARSSLAACVPNIVVDFFKIKE